MQRRRVLAAVSAVFVAGCTGPAADSSDGTTSGAVSLTDTGFAVTDAGCGSEREAASVAFDADTGTVAVTGTTSAPNTCYSARLADAAYDGGADEFRVTVEAFEAEQGGCGECITEVDYEATASFAGGLPGRVVVVHRSRGSEREVAAAGP